MEADNIVLNKEPKRKACNNRPKRILIIERPPVTIKEGKALQMKLGKKSEKPAEKTEKELSSVEKLETLDEDEADYEGSVAHYVTDEEAKLTVWRKYFGNCLCPLCGVTRWKKVPRISYSDPKAKDICKHVLGRFNAIYYYFANQLGPDVKFFAEELFFRNGQIEADGLCAITAQIWTATYLLQFEVPTMQEMDWNEIREYYLDLVWESQKISIENRKFYNLHQEFKRRISTHIETLNKTVGDEFPKSFTDLDPQPNPNEKRELDQLFLNDGLQLKNKLILLVTPPHEETHKFEDFSEFYRLKVIKYFLNIAPMGIITLGQTVLRDNYSRLKSGRLPLLTPNFPVHESKFSYIEGMEMLEEDLKELFDSVHIPTGVRSDLNDWVNTIKEITDQYTSYGQWIADKMMEMTQMCQLCYEYADKAYSMELPLVSSIIQAVQIAIDLPLPDTSEEFDAVKPRLQSCTIPINQRISLAEKRKSNHEKLETYKWLDFFRTEYHGICTKLPLMYGATEYLFIHETKNKKSLARGNAT